MIKSGINLVGEGVFWLIIATIVVINLPLVIVVPVGMLYAADLIKERAAVGFVGVSLGLWFVWIVLLLKVVFP